MTKSDIILSDDERLDEINENLTIIQRTGGLTFGTDAYLLAAFVKKCGRAAELGTGTGVASLLCLTKNRADSVYAFEIQKDFASLAMRNAGINGLSERMRVIEKDVRDAVQSDTYGAVDTVFSNPPYMKAGGGFSSKNDEMNTARRELNGSIRDFCAAASRLLRHGGLFYTVWRPDRLCDLICALREADIEPKRMVTVYPDTKTKPCLVLIESKRGASPTLIQSRPLIIYRENTRKYTEDMQMVYDSFSLEHLF